MEIMATFIVGLALSILICMFDAEQERRHKELLAALAGKE